MKNVMIFVVLITWFVLSVNAQNIPLTNPTEVVVDFDERGVLYRLHIVAKGTGLKYIAEVYGCTEEELIKINGFRAGHVLLEGDIIKIPVVKENIVFNYEPTKHGKAIVPLVYLVKPKETLFRIAKVYFGQDVKEFQMRNKLNGPDISIGQRLYVGWLSLQNTEAVKTISMQHKSEKEEITPIRNIFTEAEPNETIQLTDLEWKKQRGVAYWEKFEEGDGGRCYVLHPTARINSVMEIYNPMLKRKVKAKVLGRIPEDTYRKDISILISPTAAKALGALDSRFMVELYFAE